MKGVLTYVIYQKSKKYHMSVFQKTKPRFYFKLICVWRVLLCNNTDKKVASSYLKLQIKSLEQVQSLFMVHLKFKFQMPFNIYMHLLIKHNILSTRNFQVFLLRTNRFVIYFMDWYNHPQQRIILNCLLPIF